MKTVEVSESALESLKAMVVQLQDERDELLIALKDAVQVMEPHMGKDGYIAIRVGLARAAIAKCTQTQSIGDWREKME